MFDFLDRARALFRGSNESFVSDTFDGMRELRGIYEKSHLDLDNIETFFGAIEMGLLLDRFAGRSPAEIQRLRDSLITLIVKTLEKSIAFPVREGRPKGPSAYAALAAVIQRTYRHQVAGTQPTFAILTFNYDLCADVALAAEGVRIDYGLGGPEYRPSSMPLLKLHGSINWGYCPTCKEIGAVGIEDVHFRHPRTESVFFDVGSRLGEWTHKPCDNPLSGPPVLVPPTWSKGDGHKQIRNVWKHAAEELSNASNIFVVGYSLPESDSFFRYLFALGTESKTPLRRLWVMDPDESGTVRERFQALLGRGLNPRRVQFRQEPFTQAMNSIHKALAEDVGTMF